MTELEKLFKCWKEAQLQWYLYDKGKEYLYKNENMISFLPDGFTKIDGNANGKKPDGKYVLFIQKEPNTGGQRETDEIFWMDEPNGDRTKTKYRNRIKNILNKLNENQKNYEQEFGYMNLKKSGGESRANDEELRAYVCKFKDKISCQIEIMKPDCIVCCGCYGLLEDILQVYKKNIPIWSTYHLSYIGSNEKCVAQMYEIK